MRERGRQFRHFQGGSFVSEERDLYRYSIQCTETRKNQLQRARRREIHRGQRMLSTIPGVHQFLL